MNGTTAVAVTSRSFAAHAVLREELLAKYALVKFNEERASLTGERLVEFLRGCQMAITALEKIDDALLTQLPQLKVISKFGVGLDTIDLAAMERHGVRLGWTGGVNRRSVAELVVAFAISLLHRTPEAVSVLQTGAWRQVVGRQLSERTVGILGCGHIGKDVALLMRAFGCRVLAHDIRTFPTFYRQNNVTPVDLPTLVCESDVLTVHLPLDDSTRNILDAARLSTMKLAAVLINTARGGLVDEQCVRELLEDGRLAGAAFDVFATEPPQDMSLLRHPNFMTTPHIGGSTEEAILAMGRAAIGGLDTAFTVVRTELERVVAPGLALLR